MSRRLRGLAPVAACALATVAALPARGAPPARAAPAAVRVIGPACPVAPVSLTAFAEALRVELAGQATSCCGGADADADPGAEAGAGAVRVALAVEPCDAATSRVTVTVLDGAGPRSVRREIALDDVAPPARPRTLALAVAELVRSIQLPASPPSAAAASPAASSSPAPSSSSARPPPPPALTLGGAVAAELRFYPSRDSALAGARLSLTAARGAWQAALNADAAAGDQRTDLGSVELRVLAASASAGPRFVLRGLVVDLGLVGELGWARVAGAAASAAVSAGTGSGLIAAARAQLGIESPLAKWLRLRALVEAGVNLRGLDATADGVAAGGMSGASILAALGLGFGERSRWGP